MPCYEWGVAAACGSIGDPEEGNVQGIARTASAPDTYPATKTEFAAPVEGDAASIAHLRPLLKNTNLEFLPLRLAYDAQQDGWSAEAFHAKVRPDGPTHALARAETQTQTQTHLHAHARTHARCSPFHA